MTLKRRLIMTGLLAVLAMTALAIAKNYSAYLIAYVVEEALVQKLPAGMDPALARMRFHAFMSKLPDRQARLEKLLSMSQYLEKLQTLEPQELDRLLAVDEAGLSRDRL